MVEILTADNFGMFDKFWNEAEEDGPPVFFYFTGSKDKNGVSWCPDCVEAEPYINRCLEALNRTIKFVKVDVGDREFWKNRECPFRTDTRTRLMVIPTIIKCKGVQRLEGSQCNNPDLLKMLFEESDD